jgi:hypothetical protein
MTKKDYILITWGLRALRPDGVILKNTIWFSVVSQTANKLKADNPRFDKMKFFVACGLAE